MTRISFLIHTLFLMPVMIASALAQVKYSEPDRSVVACGVGFSRLNDQSALGFQIGYTEGFRMGISGFVEGTGSPSSATTFGLSIESGIIKPHAAFPLGIIAGLTMAQTSGANTSTSSGAFQADIYAKTGDTTFVTFYPSFIGAVTVGKKVIYSFGLEGDLLVRITDHIAVDLTPQVATSKLGTSYGVSLSLVASL